MRPYNDEMKTSGDKPSRLTRRSWAASLAAAPLLAQVSSTPPNPAPLPASSKADAEVRKVIDRLAQVEVPISVEPAFSFRA